MRGKKGPPPEDKPAQERLPGTEDAQIVAIEGAAEAYVKVRDKRQALTKLEVEAKGKLLEVMKQNGRKSYVHDDMSVEVIVEKEKVRVRIKKSDDGDE